MVPPEVAVVGGLVLKTGAVGAGPFAVDGPRVTGVAAGTVELGAAAAAEAVKGSAPVSLAVCKKISPPWDFFAVVVVLVAAFLSLEPPLIAVTAPAMRKTTATITAPMSHFDRDRSGGSGPDGGGGGGEGGGAAGGGVGGGVASPGMFVISTRSHPWRR
jgi:uncharacterized membrane protein YgcG